MATDYISQDVAVIIADYAADKHPYDKDTKKPETYSEYNRGWNDACDYIRERLEGEKPADVEPVQRGNWHIRFADEMTLCLECSVCGRKVDNIDLHHLLEAGEYGEACRRYPYCHCGAKMDLEEKMPQADNISDMLYKNLRIALMRYEDRNGHSPGHIFMESAVFWLFKYFNSSVITPNMPLTDGTTFFGIPVKEIKGNGYGIYLSDGPILLEAYEGMNSENVVYNCQGYISKTNADSIRRMNDKQLSEFLNSHMVCDCCVHEETCTDYSKPDQCRAGVLAWLQKPVQAKAGLAESAGGNQ